MQENNIEAKKQSSLDFNVMSLGFKFRDILRPRIHVIEDVGIKTCSQVLDFGCGNGSYILPVTRLTGSLGTIYALDMNPLAVNAVQKLVSKKSLSNVRVIHSDCDTGLTSSSIDIVLLYDILHYLENTDRVLTELHRVLKPDGVLSVSDHHLKKDEITARITGGRLFTLKSTGKKTFNFDKNQQ